MEGRRSGSWGRSQEAQLLRGCLRWLVKYSTHDWECQSTRSGRVQQCLRPSPDSCRNYDSLATL